MSVPGQGSCLLLQVNFLLSLDFASAHHVICLQRTRPGPLQAASRHMKWLYKKDWEVMKYRGR